MECAQSEQEIFEELGKLCISPGYIHALAFICFKDEIIRYAEEISADDFLKNYSWDRLIRTEIMTLLGLMIKSPVDFALPEAATVQKYIDDTYRIMQSLHDAMTAPVFEQITPERLREPGFDPFSQGSALREPIFYSGESAYSFQFCDLSVPKYVADDEWLRHRKGFSIQEAHDVIGAFRRIQNDKLTSTLHDLRMKPLSEWSLLEGFSLTAGEVSEACGHSIDTVFRVLSEFSIAAGEENNKTFNSLHDFNVCTSTPLLKQDSEHFVLFAQYSLVQALYDSPFYWMAADPAYKDVAMTHRGDFTERFVYERLNGVFGHDRVFRGVKIVESKSTQRTDIDVLVLFGNRAIVVQAKSKRLTLEARRGNDGQIKADFQKAVQDAYDQGYEAALALAGRGFAFIDSSGRTINIPELKQVFIICVLSDFYPALSFQAQHFLRTQPSGFIEKPIVTDVFAIDAMTEMLDSPLWLISYIHRRSAYADKLHVPDELTALSYHLKRNLWLDDEYNFVQLSDDISCDLDAAMTVRREGLPGKRTPDGILTKFAGSTIEHILRQVESRPVGAALDFAFTVLTCDEKTTRALSDGIDRIAEMAQRDGRVHDFTMSIGSSPATGVIIHCSSDPDSIARQDLHTHCKKRKYIHKAQTWFGICIDPATKTIRFGIALDYAWQQNATMDHDVREFVRRTHPGKIGRNDLCPCGSGKKYKKCCL